MKKVNYFYLLFPAMSDLISSTLQLVALNFVNPSIYLMIRGGTILTTAFFTICFLKRKLKKYHYLGCFLSLVGVTIVGVTNFAYGSGHSSPYPTSTVNIGIFLLVLSLFSQGIQFVSEEKLFEVYQLEPLQVVGMEGLWGLLVYSIVFLPFLTFFPCPFENQYCVEKNGNFYIERIDLYLYEASQNPTLLALIIIGVFTVSIFNYSGVFVAKYMSALLRSIMNVARTLTIWLTGLIITLNCNDASPNSNCQWENIDTYAILFQSVGFLIMVIGNLIYLDLIQLKFLKEKVSNKEEELILLS